MMTGVVCLLFEKMILIGIDLSLIIRTMRLKPKIGQDRNKFLALLCVAMGGHCAVNIAWVLKLFFKLAGSPFDTLMAKLILLAIRLGWIAGIVGCIALLYFLERLIRREQSISWAQKAIITSGTCCISIILYLACTRFHVTHSTPNSFNNFVYLLQECWTTVATITAVVAVVRDLKIIQPPVLVRQQVMTLIMYYLIPQTMLTLFFIRPAITARIIAGSPYMYSLLILTDLLHCAMLYFSTLRLFRLRFLNTSATIQTGKRYNFANDFQAVLLRLSKAVTLDELPYITGKFFAQAFSIPDEQVELHLQPVASRSALEGIFVEETAGASTESNLLREEKILFGDTLREQELNALISQSKILIRDELAFDYFYGQDPTHLKLLELLDSLRADILLPLYEQQLYERQVIVGYLIVRQNARPKLLYGHAEQNEMRLFAAHLGAIINLLQSRDLIPLIRHEKELKDDLFKKQQEINHFKESVRTLIKQRDHAVGVVLVKTQVIVPVNSEARSMLQRDGEAAPVKEAAYTRQLFQLARDARTYRSERTTVVMGADDAPWECTAYPSTEGSPVVVLMAQQNPMGRYMLPSPLDYTISRWEYALYLETTKSGQLINQLMPGSSEALTNFKIDLLGVALSKQAVLLELAEDDILPMVHLIHAISMRERFVTCEVIRHEQDNEYAELIFGRELSMSDNKIRGLLEVASTMGTIHIAHIERLCISSQNSLASFLVTGIYQPIGSRRSRGSAARIICSTTMPIQQLVEHNQFSPALWDALKIQSISLHSLTTALSSHDLKELVRGIAQVPREVHELAPLVQMNDRDIRDIVAHAPSSITELKQQVVQRMMLKASRHNVGHLLHLDDGSLDELPAHIKEVVRLGKFALKDKNHLLILWNEFKSQARIAALLKVNRSSVSRRLRELNIKDKKDK